MAWFVSRRNCPSFLTANTVAGPLDNSHRSGRAGSDHHDPATTLLLPRRTAHPLGAPTHFASAPYICPSAGPGKTSSVAPWLDCEPFHSQPDGGRLPLTRPPDYPTASQTCARLVPERLLLHATLTISPSIATAGHHHRRGVATSRRPHPLYWNQARPVRLPLPIILCVIATAHRFGGFGLRRRDYHAALAMTD